MARVGFDGADQIVAGSDGDGQDDGGQFIDAEPTGCCNPMFAIDKPPIAADDDRWAPIEHLDEPVDVIEVEGTSNLVAAVKIMHRYQRDVVGQRI